MAPRSKRARKAKDRLSLRSKYGNNDFSNELRYDELSKDDDPNAEILIPKSRHDDQVEGSATVAPPPKRLSKSQQRKLRRIQEEKERKERRGKILESLSQHQIGTEELSLLKPTSSRGQRETKKDALSRALKLERAGVHVDTNVRLIQEKEAFEPTKDRILNSMGMESSDSDGMDSDSDSSEGHLISNGSFERQNLKTAISDNSLGHNNRAKRQRFSEVIANQTGKKGEVKEQRGPSDLEPVKQASNVPLTKEMRIAISKAREEIAASGIIGNTQDSDEEMKAVTAKRAKAYNESGSGDIRQGLSRVVIVERPEEIDRIRSELPIIGMEQEIMESISENDVVVLCGATGCGKTTQVPQFLHEAGYGNSFFPERCGRIGITQPRRVAAVSTATRVAEELGSELGQIVGYQVRYDKQIGSGTSLKFMTDGILLREVQGDFLLRNYSAIIIDEAHERSLNTDILLGMLSRIVSLRRSMFEESMKQSSHKNIKVYPLKLIIMSATLRTEDFVENKRLFPQPPPLLSVPTRQFPVTVHFSRRTELHDYVGAAYKKVCQIHRNLPPGGILVFLTGQREVEYLCRKLKNTFKPKKKPAMLPVLEAGLKDNADVTTDMGLEGNQSVEDNKDIARDEIMLLDALEEERYAGQLINDLDELTDETDDSEDDDSAEDVLIMGGEGLTPQQIREAEDKLAIDLKKASGEIDIERDEDDKSPEAVHVLPLFAMLPAAQQASVFKPPPPGARLIVVATNVAETSLTIPGIRYVVDAGRSKQKLLEANAGLSRFEVRWVSQASAEQRAGRAGRTGPGHCYRLYSSAVFNDTFPRHSPPEIANSPLESVVLSLKGLGVHKISNFPFPSPPDQSALKAAEQCLIALMALDPENGTITDIGKEMSIFPISPRHARMLLEILRDVQASIDSSTPVNIKQKKHRKIRNALVDKSLLLSYAIGMAAALSIESPFVHIDGTHTQQNEEIASERDDDTKAVGNTKIENTDVREDNNTNADEDKRKQQLTAARKAHAKLRVLDSDALSALNTLCAFEDAGETETFCRQNFLHFKNLREAAALRKQLARLVSALHFDSYANKESEKDQNLKNKLLSTPGWPISETAMHALRRALTAGWADHVARRIRSYDHVMRHNSDRFGRRGRAIRYLPCLLDEDVFLHPNSSAHALAAEYVVYSEIIHNSKRPYMSGVTVVDPVWLPHVASTMCEISEPLSSPEPFYSSTSDKVFCWRNATFGRHMWPLPKHASPHPSLEERVAAFADALLLGKVISSASFLSKIIVSQPSMSSRLESRAQKRAADLLGTLERHSIDNKKSLVMKWRKDPNFLKQEIAAWVQKGYLKDMMKTWPMMLKEALS